MPVNLPSLGDVPAADWQALSRQRIFFGHQSVGWNILEGIGDVMREHPEIHISIVEGARPELFDRPTLGHAGVGRNGDPPSKILDFQRMIDAGLGGRVDIALFKFCYVDFAHASDVEATFAGYAQTMAELEARYPGTLFLHATVPLRSMPVTWEQKIKHLAKRLLQRPDVLADNAKRQRFNELLKQRFPPDRIFDLALAEAVAPDGTLEVAGSGAEPVMMLYPAFTDDGGHLNPLGRKRVAEQLLITLARTASGHHRVAGKVENDGR